MWNKAHASILILGSTVILGCETSMGRIGQSTSVQFGVVRDVQEITLQSKAPQGALLGGTLGVLAGSGNSAAGNAIRGAALGGGAAAIAQGNRTGKSYTVSMLDGSSKRIVTDQREIHVGDCVSVERVGDSANIRRVPAGYCDPANEQAVKAVDASVRSEAMACENAKRELAKASDPEAAQFALRKAELLCDG